jgi:hypothetical protein
VLTAAQIRCQTTLVPDQAVAGCAADVAAAACSAGMVTNSYSMRDRLLSACV